jgi:hypothetical protein
MKSKFLIPLVLALVFSCGGGDSRPKGTYNYITGSSFIDQGCTDSFMNFLSVNIGETFSELKVKLEPEGDDSLSFRFKNFESTLSPMEDEDKKWIGTITGTVTISGCRIGESLHITVEDLGDDKIEVVFVDEWSNMPLTEDCPFAEDSCTNLIVAKGKKI